MCALKLPSQTRYRKRVGKFNGVDYKHDESVLSFSTASRCYNFDFSDGSLKTACGFADSPVVPKDAKKYWVYKSYTSGKPVERYVYQLENGLLKFYEPSENTEYHLSGFPYEDVDMINYRLNSQDVMLISCKGVGLMSWDGMYVTKYKDAPTIKSMALHYERLFVISVDEPTRVYFSDDLDPTNWTIGSDAAGFIELLDERGEMTKVVSFLNYLYIFREHGISRIAASGMQSQFSAVNLYMTTGRIFPSSIVKCGGVILFAATDGFYVFDGYECRKILDNISRLINGEPLASAFFNGKYFLSLPMYFGDGEKILFEDSDDCRCNALLMYDVVTGEYSITRGIDIRFMNPVSYGGKDFLAACDPYMGGQIIPIGAYCGKALKRLWQSPETDFGQPDKAKYVRDVYIETSADCEVVVKGRRTKKFQVGAGKHRLRCNIIADKLSVTIMNETVKCNIRPPTIVFTEYRR